MLQENHIFNGKISLNQSIESPYDCSGYGWCVGVPNHFMTFWIIHKSMTFWLFGVWVWVTTGYPVEWTWHLSGPQFIHVHQPCPGKSSFARSVSKGNHGFPHLFVCPPPVNHRYILTFPQNDPVIASVAGNISTSLRKMTQLAQACYPPATSAALTF